jgi:uncharacterized Zn-binding protein involved in type VI secretion
MMFQRTMIVDQDVTTVGGRVESSPLQYPSSFHGFNQTFQGDPVWCPACNSYGKTKCVPPFRPYTGSDGRQANLDGDLCICNCPNPPRLIGRLTNCHVSFGVDEIEDMPGSSAWMVYAGHIEKVQYDEQVLFSTAAATMSGIPVVIETNDGRMVSGYLGNDGLMPRVETIGAGFYHVYWGDEALEKMQLLGG